MAMTAISRARKWARGSAAKASSAGKEPGRRMAIETGANPNMHVPLESDNLAVEAFESRPQVNCFTRILVKRQAAPLERGILARNIS
jgi:hypothetical protein